MANLLRSLFRESRANETTTLSIYDWAKQFRPGQQVTYQGQSLQGFQLGAGPGYGPYEQNSVVFACEAKRISVFSEARFVFQQLRQSRPGDLYGTPALDVLAEPWVGASLRDLLATAELDVGCHGNSYWVVDRDGFLLRLDPAHVKILTEQTLDPVSGFPVGEQLIGYAYVADRSRVTIYEPRQIAHYKPIPGPVRWLGQSWLSACLPDIDADTKMTEHKQSALTNGAKLSTVVNLDSSVTEDEFWRFVRAFKEQHEGPENAGKVTFLQGGADVKTIGQSFEDLALKATQGATETRIAACAGVHPVIVGLSEGMQGSSLNSGNYTAAKRNFVDGTMRPLWGAFAGSFQWLVDVPSASRLWYDDRDIAFLREDVTDQAEILFKDAQLIRTLIDAGFDPDAVITAAKARDMGRLMGSHTGWYSVQLQQPGEGEDDIVEAETGERPALGVA